MTCKLGQRCNLCDPLSDFSITKDGRNWPRKLWGKTRKRAVDKLLSLPLKAPAYHCEGNLTYEIAHPGQISHTPIVLLCDGCLTRVLNR